MKLGVIIPLNNNVDAEFSRLNQLGFETCQLNCWDDSLFTDENANKVISAAKKYGITISALWCGWQGPAVWDFYDGPLTLGLVPSEYRAIRTKNLMTGVDFAEKINVTDIVTHAGFLPEVPASSQYNEVISVIRYLAQYCKSKHKYFVFETGQETPVTLKRAIEDIGTDNLGINLDPANLILYGKANPVDAIDVFGKYIRGVHAKDGFYPTDGKNLGIEVPLGEGLVNFPMLISKLKNFGYDGAITIEREISGEKQIADIIKAKTFLEKIIEQEDIRC